MQGVSLRGAGPEDVETLFRWRNLPEVVAVGGTNRPVAWEEHRQWFHEFLSGRGYALRIILLDGEPIGQVRFDRRDHEVLSVSIYLIPGRTGRGYGVTALELACREAFGDLAIERIEACILPHNSRSVSAFRKAGFVNTDPDPVEAGPVRYLLSRSRFEAQNAGALESNQSWAEDDRRTIDHFTGLAVAHGAAVRALDWGSRESQELRFAKLAQIGDLRGESVLDIGCGQGDLLAWLREQHIETEYRGIDITPAMIDIAKRRFPAQDFLVGDVLKQPPPPRSVDYVLASGLFYLRRNDPTSFMKTMIWTLFRACRKGLAFNSLSTWSHTHDANEFHADPADVIGWCRELTSRLVLLHDYHPRDFSVYLYR